MQCPNCGKQIPDNSTFCGGCGAKINASAGGYPPPPYPYYPSRFSLWVKKEGGVALTMKIIALVNLLFAIVGGIVLADANLFNYVSVGFGGFLVVFFIGLAGSTIIYGISELVRDISAIRRRKVDEGK